MNPTEQLSSTDVKAIFATAGYYSNANTKAYDNDDVDPLLNNVSASFKQGLICCTTTATAIKEYYFISTRNNNFSNRSQKLKIRVTAPTNLGVFNYFPAEATS